MMDGFYLREENQCHAPAVVRLSVGDVEYFSCGSHFGEVLKLVGEGWVHLQVFRLSERRARPCFMPDSALSIAMRWRRATFGDMASILGTVRHLQDEVRELSESISTWGPLASGSLDVRAELADVLILAHGLADELGIDVDEAVISKVVELRSRKWHEPDGDGVIRHVAKPPQSWWGWLVGRRP